MLCIYIKDTFTLCNKTDTDRRPSTHVKKKKKGMFYLVLHLLYWTIVFLFQTDLMYVKSDLFPHILQQFKWGFSQFLIINKKLKAIWEAMSENKGRKMAIPLEWKSWVKHGPLWLISKETLLFREASTSDLSQFPTCPERPDLWSRWQKVYIKSLQNI